MEKRRKVLVVEDDRLIAMDLKLSLIEHGYDVDMVTGNEQEAMAYLLNARPDIALLDINLGNGKMSFAIARRLREVNCPIIVVSGYSQSSFPVPEELAETVWVAKPFNEQALMAQMNEVV